MSEGLIEITNNKPVWVYYRDSSFIGKWESIRKAAKDLGIHYSSACKVVQGKDSQTKGYKFFLNKQSNITSFTKPTNASKINVTYIVDDGENKLEFRGQEAVAKYFNTTKGTINQYIVNKKPYKKKYMIYKLLPCN